MHKSVKRNRDSSANTMTIVEPEGWVVGVRFQERAEMSLFYTASRSALRSIQLLSNGQVAVSPRVKRMALEADHWSHFHLVSPNTGAGGSNSSLPPL